MFANRWIVAGLAGGMLAPVAWASTFGSLANFDAVNDTGKPAYGFEIEIEDSTFDSSMISSVFGYDRNFGLAGGPGAVVRYGVPSIEDVPGFGVRITYGGVIGSIFTPTGSYNTPGESCWPLAGGWSTSQPCDHYGVSTIGQPAATTYNWLVESAPGSGVLVKESAAIPPIAFAYSPPAAGAPAAVRAVAAPVAPNPEDPEDQALWGEAFWLKTFTTEVEHEIDLGDLLRGDEDQEAAEVEVEWRVFQKAPAGEGGDEQEMEVVLGDAAKALIRRYEFFEYLGPLNPEDGEAICKSDCENDPLGLGGTHPNYVGAYVGAQMAGFNVEAIHAAVPEPQGWAMMLAGLGVIGMCAYRRSASW